MAACLIKVGFLGAMSRLPFLGLAAALWTCLVFGTLPCRPFVLP